MTARKFADKIWGTEDLKDISEFNIPLDSAVNMMEKYAKDKASILSRVLDNLAKHGGYIVSTNVLSASEITEASACDEMYVNDDGLGFARVGNLPDKC